MNMPDLLPLERILAQKSQAQAGQPSLRENLYTRYESCREFLREHIYPFIDAGLASLSEENGLYTLHGPDHFDEVIYYAGLLLSVDSGLEKLNTYELFLLLIAIRIHDAGNMFGREQHEGRTYEILTRMGEAIFPDSFETRHIASIAGAHGGTTPGGSKDTISELRTQEVFRSITFRPRLLAALVRFADEICESRNRAANVLMQTNSLPTQNEVFHKYASTIKSVHPEPEERRVLLIYDLWVDDVLRKWGKRKINDSIEEVFLIDEIFSRLEKMFRERQYCKRFMRDVCDIDQINARIEIHRQPTSALWYPQESLAKVIEIRSEPEGYPFDRPFLAEQYQINGESLLEELREQSAPLEI